jgi:hypothetical protein
MVPDNPIFNIMGVSAIEIKPSINSPAGVEFIKNPGGERLRWVPCAHFEPDREKALGLVFSNEINFDTSVIIEADKPTIQPICDFSDSKIFILEEHPNEIIIKVDSRSAGWVVLSDVWYPGWVVFIDGQKHSVEHANYLFKAAQVPEGNHLVKFIYRPTSFFLGTAISFLSVVGITIFTFYDSRIKKKF